MQRCLGEPVAPREPHLPVPCSLFPVPCSLFPVRSAITASEQD
ncbi:hypothetical protein [Moorena producens]